MLVQKKLQLASKPDVVLAFWEHFCCCNKEFVVVSPAACAKSALVPPALHHSVMDVTGEGPEWSHPGGDWHQTPCLLEANGGQRRVRQGQKDWSGLEPP